jgi:6-pyruvoyltetrahydropterin/6-carboxytetrahydropterin synthase
MVLLKARKGMHISRKFEFDTAHRLLNHESKCRHLHGHRYVAEITVSSKELDSIGRVIDFNHMKSIFGTWIDENWCHNTILHQDDPLVAAIQPIVERDLYLLECNPTVENMATELFAVAERLLVECKLNHLQVEKIVLWETPNSSATVTRQ